MFPLCFTNQSVFLIRIIEMVTPLQTPGPDVIFKHYLVGESSCWSCNAMEWNNGVCGDNIDFLSCMDVIAFKHQYHEVDRRATPQ